MNYGTESAAVETAWGRDDDSFADLIGDFEQLRCDAQRNRRRLRSNTAGLDESELIECEQRMAAAAEALNGRLSNERRLQLHRLYMTVVRQTSIRERQERHGDESSLDTALEESADERSRILTSLDDTARFEPTLVFAFAWWLVWWNDARRDAVAFVFRPGENPRTAALFGRPPSGHQHLCLGFYDEACRAEREHDRSASVARNAAGTKPGHL